MNYLSDLGGGVNRGKAALCNDLWAYYSFGVQIGTAHSFMAK